MKLHTSCVLLVFLAFLIWNVGAALYPGQTDTHAAGSGAPQGLSSGWMPPVAPPTVGIARRPPIQGFPSLANTDVGSATNDFNSKFVPRPFKALPQNHYDILQALRMQFKRIFPGGLPASLDALLNSNSNFNPNSNSNFNPNSNSNFNLNRNSYQAAAPPPQPYFHPMPTAPVKPKRPAGQPPQQPQPSMLQPNQPPRGFNWSPPPRKPIPGPPQRPSQRPVQRPPTRPAQGPVQLPALAPRSARQPYNNYHSFRSRFAFGFGIECSSRFIPGQLCCDGVRNMIPPGGQGQFMCCHKGIYNITSQVCCGDMPIPRPPKSRHMLCCGTMLFDPKTHICCDKFAYVNQGGAVQCCQKRPFNPTREMCCGETLKPRLRQHRGMACCGKHMYNTGTHICCEEGNMFPKTPGMGCCGKNPYRPAFEQCCFGDAVPKGGYCFAK